MIIPEKYYSVLKWVAMIALPAIATFVSTVGLATRFEFTDLAVLVITAFATLLGALIGVSSANYNKSTNEGDD